MPELPEVETIVRGLRGGLVGRSIQRVRVLRPDVVRQELRSFSAGLRGRTVERVTRRGKNIVVSLSDDRVLVVNLGMTGRLLFSMPTVRATYPAVRFTLDQEPGLVFDDVRRFGSLEVLTVKEWVRRSEDLGPEPLGTEYTASRMLTDLARSTSPVRSWFLDQRRVAGVGNIYANEALFLAAIHPRRPAKSVNTAEARVLHRAIRQVLRTAIENRGTTLRDYRDASGSPGENSGALRVYGRAGQPCLSCSTEVQRLVFGNRSAFFCPRCQPETDTA